jgi:stringent starvation protein B
MTSTRPYLLRAMHEWMLDNELTPQLVVDAVGDDVAVPRQFVTDGRIVLNISPGAVRDLQLGNDLVQFKARFAGVPFNVSVPLRAVVAVFARENGAGMTFPEEAPGTEPSPPSTDGPPAGRPQLKVVK